MKKYLYLFFALFLLPGISSASQLTVTTTSDACSGIGGTNGKNAQTFTGSDVNAAIEYVAVHMTGVGSGTLTATIQTTSGGSPTGSVLATSDGVAGTDIPATDTLVVFHFPTPYTVSGGTVYAVVITATGSGQCINIDSAAPYAGGQYGQYASSWTMFSGYDMQTIIGYIPPAPVIVAATSTVDQAEQNTFNGFLVYFIAFFGVVWLLRKH